MTLPEGVTLKKFKADFILKKRKRKSNTTLSGF